MPTSVRHTRPGERDLYRKVKVTHLLASKYVLHMFLNAAVLRVELTSNICSFKNAQEFETYKRALLCAHYPKLSAPEALTDCTPEQSDDGEPQSYSSGYCDSGSEVDRSASAVLRLAVAAGISLYASRKSKLRRATVEKCVQKL